MSEFCRQYRPPNWTPIDYEKLYKEEKTVNVTVDGTDFKITIASKEIVPNKVYVDVLKSAAKKMQSGSDGGVAVQINGTIFKIIIQCATEKTLSTEKYKTVLKTAAEKIDGELTTTQIFSSLFNQKPGENTFSPKQIVGMIEALSQEDSKKVKRGCISFIIARFSEIISEKDAAMLRALIESQQDNSEAMGNNSNTGKGIDDR